MSLKQKFFDVYTKYYKKSNELDKMVEVADDYAIEFAEWVEWYDFDGFKSKKELLEIFKKEKGL
jgi:hypothetical protein